MRAVDVVVDGSGRLGSLSYLVPDGMNVVPGSVIEVPFGKTVRFGVVIGEGDVFAATRHMLSVVGRRADPADIDAVQRLSRRHLQPSHIALGRLAPTKHKGAAATIYPAPQLCDEADRHHGGEFKGKVSSQRFILRPHQSDPAALAARFALEMASGGQVLVLCPTKALVDAVCRRFTNGADRIDANAERGAWASFRDGLLPIGVGTRACSWYSPAQLAGIVVVESGHVGHVEAREPHTSSRDVAWERTTGTDTELIMFDNNFDVAALRSGVTLWEPNTCWWPKVTWWDRQPQAVPAGLKRELALWGRRKDQVLVVATDTCRRLCNRCRIVKECDQHHAATCICTPLCRRCGDDTSFVVGWDAQRLSQHFGSIPGADSRTIVDFGDLSRIRQQFQRVILLNADVTGTHFTPVQTTINRFNVAAGYAQDELAIVMRDPQHPAVIAATEGNARTMMRAVWEEARHLGFPPFGHVARIVTSGVRAPDLSAWPGKILGPRRNRSGGWEFLVCFTDGDLDNLSGIVERLKKRGRVQVHVDGPTHLF